jgi:hypothetical protein
MEVFYGFLLLLRTNRKRIHTTNIIISFKAEFGGGGGGGGTSSRQGRKRSGSGSGT